MKKIISIVFCLALFATAQAQIKASGTIQIPMVCKLVMYWVPSKYKNHSLPTVWTANLLVR